MRATRFSVTPEDVQTEVDGQSVVAQDSWWCIGVLAIVALVASVSVAWVKTTVEEEGQFVATRVAEGVVEASGVEAWVAGTLPDGLRFFSVPVTESITTAIEGAANQVIVSDAFGAVWSIALRVAHKGASAVISGNGSALESEGRVASVNLDDIAGVVIEKVEATGLDLPDVEGEFGSIVLYEDQQLAAVQSLAQAIDTLGRLLSLSAPVFIPAAI